MQLYLDSLERLEDSDRASSKSSRQEECIDLIDFCDEKDDFLLNGNLHIVYLCRVFFGFPESLCFRFLENLFIKICLVGLTFG